ncbi:lycopene cyclase family protein [Amycolatopsis sp. NPDC051758]|uniref:lycopene cyclase family protein n=1 Tax=Amycolatopsis sp. NPDC051758 TaxID=3363935 RepID=UPI00379CCA63
MTPTSYDVAIVGAGPAGSTAALALATRGHRVALIGPPPQHPDRQILLAGSAVQALTALGVDIATTPHARRVTAIRLSTRDDISPAELEFPGLCLSDHHLRDTLRQAAIQAGVVHFVRAATALPAGESTPLRLDDGTTLQARHIVDARGYQPSGPDPTEEPSQTPAIGWATSQRFTTTTTTTTTTAPTGPILHMAVPAQHAPRDTPLAVWLLPDTDGHVTITVIHVAAAIADPAPALAQGLQLLAHRGSGIADLRPAGPISTGALDTGYAPTTIRHAPHLHIGDIAGLVNPFTGEGLSYTIDSATLAADAITAHRADPLAAIRSYARSLERSFIGYFETSRHAVRRYQLAWRVLSAAADNDHPFIVKGRRAILLPEGITGLADVATLTLADDDTAAIRPFLLACDEILASTIRHQWPFLARLMLTSTGATGRRLRPAILFAGAASASGTLPDPDLAPMAAAIELASLAALAFLTTGPPTSPDQRGIDWAATTVILAGDYLLAEASRLIASHASTYAFTFAEWLDDLVALRAAATSTNTPNGQDMFETIFEFPARVGAEAGGVAPATGAQLREFARSTGSGFLHTEELLALRGARTRLDTTLAALINDKVSNLPITVLDDPSERRHQLTQRIAACADVHSRAIQQLDGLTDTIARRLLASFADTACKPGTRESVPLS